MPTRPPPEKDFVARVARRIAAARRALGITQEDFAALVGTAPRSYQRMESGAQNLTLRTIERIAAALKISPEELVVGEPESVSSRARLAKKRRERGALRR